MVRVSFMSESLTRLWKFCIILHNTHVGHYFHIVIHIVHQACPWVRCHLAVPCAASFACISLFLSVHATVKLYIVVNIRKQLRDSI